MKAKLILTCVLVALCGNAFAQDIIRTIDGRSIEAKVLEINDNDIIYKTFDNPDGPDYRLPISRVARIVFQNGTEQTFAPSSILFPSPYSYDPYGPYGPLEYRWGHYYDRHGRLYGEQLRDYLGVSLYGSEYLKASSQYQWGLWLTLGGAALLLSSVSFNAMMSDYDRSVSSMNMPSSWQVEDSHSSMGAYFAAEGLIGAACIGVGIPLWVKGRRELDKILDDYAERYAPRPYAASITAGPTRNGFGLAFNF